MYDVIAQTETVCTCVYVFNIVRRVYRLQSTSMRKFVLSTTLLSFDFFARKLFFFFFIGLIVYLIFFSKLFKIDIKIYLIKSRICTIASFQLNLEICPELFFKWTDHIFIWYLPGKYNGVYEILKRFYHSRILWNRECVGFRYV